MKMAVPAPRYKKTKLLLIGPYPPPYGGVSIHIRRLKGILNTFFEMQIIDESQIKKKNIVNARALWPFPYLRLIIKSDVVHIHSGHYIFRLLHFIVSKTFGKKIILTIHSYSEEKKGITEKYIDKNIMKRVSKVVFVSEELFNRFSLPNSFLKEAFLPPRLSEEENLPPEISNWISKKKKDEYLIACANAWRLDTYKNEDLYGLDLCVEAAKCCAKMGMKLAFIFIVSDKNGKLDINDYRKLILDYNLEDIFLLYDSPVSFVKLIVESDIVLRTTNTDGDALTIREGIFFCKKVIASDVVQRPQLTDLFKNRDPESLTETIKKTYENIRNRSTHTKIDSPLFDYTGYLNFYKDILYN
jgi:hypothetical protein